MGGPFWTVPELLFEKKELIPALQQLLIQYRTHCINLSRGLYYRKKIDLKEDLIKHTKGLQVRAVWKEKVMLGDEDLLRKLECYIKKLANEWAEKSDALFISEFGLQARLLNLLWNDPELWFEVPLEQDSLVVRLPVAYGEWYASYGKKSDKKFDVALLEQSTIEKWAKWPDGIRWSGSGYPERAAKLPVLAAIEIKDKVYPWSAAVSDDLDKLKHCIDAGQVKNGYLIVFYPADKPSAAKKIEEIAQSHQRLWGNRHIKICFCPCNNRGVKPRWLPKSGVNE